MTDPGRNLRRAGKRGRCGAIGCGACGAAGRHRGHWISQRRVAGGRNGFRYSGARPVCELAHACRGRAVHRAAAQAKGDAGARRAVEALGIPAHRWITIVDPMSAVAPDAKIGPGCIIGPFVSVGPGARLGAHTVLRAGAYVGHDCRHRGFRFRWRKRGRFAASARCRTAPTLRPPPRSAIAAGWDGLRLSGLARSSRGCRGIRDGLWRAGARDLSRHEIRG